MRMEGKRWNGGALAGKEFVWALLHHLRHLRHADTACAGCTLAVVNAACSSGVMHAKACMHPRSGWKKRSLAGVLYRTCIVRRRRRRRGVVSRVSIFADIPRICARRATPASPLQFRLPCMPSLPYHIRHAWRGVRTTCTTCHRVSRGKLACTTAPCSRV